MVTLIAYISPKRYTKLYILFNNANFLVIIFFRHSLKTRKPPTLKEMITRLAPPLPSPTIRGFVRSGYKQQKKKTASKTDSLIN